MEVNGGSILCRMTPEQKRGPHGTADALGPPLGSFMLARREKKNAPQVRVFWGEGVIEGSKQCRTRRAGRSEVHANMVKPGDPGVGQISARFPHCGVVNACGRVTSFERPLSRFGGCEGGIMGDMRDGWACQGRSLRPNECRHTSLPSMGCLAGSPYRFARDLARELWP